MLKLSGMEQWQLLVSCCVVFTPIDYTKSLYLWVGNCVVSFPMSQIHITMPSLHHTATFVHRGNQTPHFPRGLKPTVRNLNSCTQNLAIASGRDRIKQTSCAGMRDCRFEGVMQASYGMWEGELRSVRELMCSLFLCALLFRCSEGLESLSTSVNKELSQGLLGLAVLCVQRLKKLHGHLIALMTACSTANDQTSSAEPIASGSAQIDVSYFKDLLVTSISILMDGKGALGEMLKRLEYLTKVNDASYAGVHWISFLSEIPWHSRTVVCCEWMWIPSGHWGSCHMCVTRCQTVLYTCIFYTITNVHFLDFLDFFHCAHLPLLVLPNLEPSKLAGCWFAHWGCVRARS